MKKMNQHETCKIVHFYTHFTKKKYYWTLGVRHTERVITNNQRITNDSYTPK